MQFKTNWNHISANGEQCLRHLCAVLNLFMHEQLMKTMSHALQAFILERTPDSLDALTRLADQYTQTHRLLLPGRVTGMLTKPIMAEGDPSNNPEDSISKHKQDKLSTRQNIQHNVIGKNTVCSQIL